VTFGPPGIGIAPGAPVALVSGAYGGIAICACDCDEWAVVRVADDGVEYFPQMALALDLSGPLEFGLRALLGLLEEDQPRCAPAWRRAGGLHVWILAWGNKYRYFQHGDAFSRPGLDVWSLPGLADADPALALAIVLAALAEEAPSGQASAAGTP